MKNHLEFFTSIFPLHCYNTFMSSLSIGIVGLPNERSLRSLPFGSNYKFVILKEAPKL